MERLFFFVIAVALAFGVVAWEETERLVSDGLLVSHSSMW